MKNIAIYGRVDSEDLEEVLMQCEICFQCYLKDVKEKKYDSNVLIIYENKPSTDVFPPKLLNLFNLMASGEIDLVYVKNVSRLTRKIDNLVFIKFLLEQTNTDIYIIDNNEFLYKDRLSKLNCGIKLVEPSYDEMEKE